MRCSASRASASCCREDIALSADDTPLSLDREGLATVSAPHAYLLTFALLDLGAGDHLLELGTGTGYGAAVARDIVGSRGRLASIEIDAQLAARARRIHGLLDDGEPPQIVLLEGDATEVAPEVLAAIPEPRPPIKVAVTYALRAVPDWLVGVLPEGARLVAPIISAESDETQELWMWGESARAPCRGAPTAPCAT